MLDGEDGGESSDRGKTQNSTCLYGRFMDRRDSEASVQGLRRISKDMLYRARGGRDSER